VGFVHQSNGRSDPLSRSWNRIYAMVALERDRFVLQLRPWHRIREDPTRDDNADIVDHVGWMEILASYTTPRDHSVTLLVRTPFHLDPGWGSAEADWRFPISNDLKGYLTAFTGYGESLIDYNFRKTSVGLGISIGSYY
jgi:phospholipase A1